MGDMPMPEVVQNGIGVTIRQSLEGDEGNTMLQNDRLLMRSVHMPAHVPIGQFLVGYIGQVM